MTGNIKRSLTAAGVLILASCAAGPGPNHRYVPQGQPEALAAEPALSETEQSLLAEFNAARQRAGRSPLPVSARLSRIARAESQSSAASGHQPASAMRQLLETSGYSALGTVHGRLKDRGPQTGASFVDYWSQSEGDTVLGEWSTIGVGISNSPDGRLLAVVLLGRS